MLHRVSHIVRLLAGLISASILVAIMMLATGSGQVAAGLPSSPSDSADDTAGLSDSTTQDPVTGKSTKQLAQAIPVIPLDTASPTPPPSCGPGANYIYTQSTGVPIVPGTNLVPNTSCDECTTSISLPFTYYFYGQPYTSAIVGSNGALAFATNGNGFNNLCLPRATFSNAILAHWDDLDMSAGGGLGIYTSVTGAAPNRIFNIEWRACRYGLGCGALVNFEIRLYESQARFALIYGEVDNSGTSATIGVQRGTGSQLTEYACNTSGSLPQGLQLDFSQPQCPTNTPTRTPTRTVTNTPTQTHTPTLTPTRTVTNTPTLTPTRTPTRTPTNTLTVTNTPTQTDTPTPTVTGTPPTGTNTPTSTNTPQVTATPTCQAGGGGLPGPWSLVANGALDVYGSASASDGTNAFFAGGYSFSAGTSTIFQKYNPSTNIWTTLAPVPIAQAMGSLIYSPSTLKLYLFGGEDPTTAVVYNSLYIYDIASNAWSTGAVMPDVRAFMASGYYNGHAYLVGGYSTGNVDPAFTQVWDYDIAAGTYTTRASVPDPTGFGGAGSGVINGHLYVAGGRNINNVALSTLYNYDIASDSWTTGASMPSGDNVPGSGVMGGDLFIIGGGNPFNGTSPTGGIGKAGNSNSNTNPKAAFPSSPAKGGASTSPQSPQTTGSTVYYDPATNTWATGNTLNHIRSFPGATNVGSTYLVTYGGYDGSSTTATTEVATGAGGGGCATPTGTPQATPTCQAGGTPGPWVVASPVPYAARGPAVVSDGTYIYINGGYDGGSVHNNTYRYDPATDTYTPLAPSPDDHFLGQGVYDPSNNKIYIPDGFGDAGQTNTMRIYDIASNSWTTGANAPDALSDLATMYYNGKVYIAGGYNGGATNALYAYDIASNSWSTLAPMPTALYLPGFGAINGKLYVASGNNGSSELTTLYIYDIASNGWSMGAPIPTGVTGPGSAVVNGTLWVIGGGAPFPTTTTMTQIYDPVSNSWSVGPSMNTPRVWFYADVAGGKVVAPGGDSSPGIPINDNETASTGGGGGCGTPQPTPTQGNATTTATCQAGGTPGPWTAAAPYPITDVRYGFAQVGDSFYVIGGVSDGIQVQNVYRYDVGPNTWTPLANIPVASEAPSCAYNSGTNKIYCSQGDTGNSFQIYDIASNSWTAGPAVPGEGDRYGAASGSFGTKVYIVGGGASGPGSTDVEVYDTGTNSWTVGNPIGTQYFLGGYQVVGQYLYVVGSFSASPDAAANSSVLGKNKSHPAHPSSPSKSLPGAPDANDTGTYRLDMSTGTWTTGPTWTMGRADMGVAYSGGKLYAMGGDASGGSYFDSTNEVDELDVSAWPSGSWTTSAPNLPAPNRQANQAGFTSADGRIWSVGGIDGSTFQFLSDNLYRSNGGGCGGGTPTNTPTATATAACGTGVLYDQYGTPATDDTSQDFETAFDAYDNTAADDFVVPSGQTWTISEVDAGGDVSIARPSTPLFNVYIYQNNGGLPGTQVYSALSQTAGGSGAEYDVTLSSPAVLSAGSYWVSVQARWDFNVDGQWYWENQAAQAGDAAAWQNPGDGFGTGCTSWANMETCLGQSGNPDQVYRLIGSTGGGCASPSPTPAGTPPTATPTACSTNYTYTVSSGATIVAGTDDTGNHCDDCLTSVTLPFAYSLYGQSFTTANVDSNGTLQFVANVSTFTNTCLPATGYTYTIFPMWDDLYTLNSGFGIYTSVSGTAPNRIFNIEWRAQYFPGTGNANFEVRLYEGESRFDLIYGAIDDQGASATVGVQKDASSFTQYECNTGGLTQGTMVSFILTSCATPQATPTAATPPTTDTPVPTGSVPPATVTPIPTRTASNTPTPAPACGSNAPYALVTSMATFVPAGGFVDRSRCDDCMLRPELPFPYTLYGQTYTTVDVGSNGYLQFGVPSPTPISRQACDPDVAPPTSIMGYWADLDMSDPLSPTLGIYTATVGIAPNRTFVVRWEAAIAGTTDPVDFEILLHEGESRYDVIYGATQGEANTTVGIRGQFPSRWTPACSLPITNDLMLTFSQPQCATATPTSTASVATPTPPTSSPTACMIQFTDVPPGSTFYPYVTCLACKGIINGYSTGCTTGNPCFRPNSQVTRGQMSKIVSNAAAFSEPHNEQTFTDVPPSHTFYIYIERLASRNVVGGYACGGPGEPCVPPENRPYFRSANNTTRGQLSKIVCRAYGCTGTPAGQTFEDVPSTHTFYMDIGQLYAFGAINGYPCGNPEPCVPPQNRPYFRPANNVTRGQASKIVANTFFPGCNLLVKPLP